MLHRRRWSLCAGLAAILLLLAGLAGPARAQLAGAPPSANDAFAVSDIQVDVTSANANTQRDQAIAQAQRKAWDTLYQRMVPGGGAAPRLSDTDLSRLIQGFDIQNEQVSPNRYVGLYTVRFRPQAVRDQLNGAGTASYVEPPTKPTVVLPVTVADGRPVLWEDRTPWRQAWEERDSAGAFVPLVVPDGELEDLQAVTAADALAGNADSLARIAQRYKAGGVLVAKIATPAGEPDPKQPLTVEVTRYGLDGTRDQQTLTVKPDAADRPADLLRRAVTFTTTAIDQMWRKDNVMPTGAEQTVRVAVPLSGLPDWIEAKRRLAGVNAVTRADVASLSRTQAVINLSFRGDVAGLQQAMAKRDLALTAAPAMAVPAPVPGQPALAATGPAWELRLGGPGGVPPGASTTTVPYGNVPSAVAPGGITATPLAAPGGTGGTLGTLRPATRN